MFPSHDRGGGVESIEQDPNIPPDRKAKLIELFKSGPEGRKQALELMDTLGYGVEPLLEPDPFYEPPQNFADAYHKSANVHNIGPYKGGGTFTWDEEDPNQYGKYYLFGKDGKRIK